MKRRKRKKGENKIVKEREDLYWCTLTEKMTTDTDRNGQNREREREKEREKEREREGEREKKKFYRNS